MQERPCTPEDRSCSGADEHGGLHSRQDGELCHVDSAIAWAARTVQRELEENFFGLPPENAAPSARAVQRAVASRGDRLANSATVKDAARTLGADLVGICKLNRAWLTAGRENGRAVQLPDEYACAVVMAVAMDPAAIGRSPAPAAAAATRVGYMRMAVCASGLALFIRRRGYKAAAAGNGTALSIPLAVDGGLGEMGQSHMLITQEYGPCVRICKVFTDMPLCPDEPVEFGVRRFCESCRRCVEACPAGAIPPEWAVPVAADRTGRPSAGHPRVDGERCRSFWKRNGSSCATCVAVCPFTRVPGRPGSPAD